MSFVFLCGRCVKHALNLQTMFHLSGQKVDLDKVKELTLILENTDDSRAEKGHRLLKGAIVKHQKNFCLIKVICYNLSNRR